MRVRVSPGSLKKERIMKKKVVKKDESKVLRIEIFCGNLDKNVSVDISKLYFSGYESECELCGSHGSVNVSVECECGKTHDIQLNSW